MLLSVQSIEKRYGAESLFSHLSFTIDEGHKVALVGKNGVGKSTIMKIIAGLESADSGDFFLSNNKKLSYLPQEVKSNDTRTGVEYIQDGIDLLAHQFVPVLEGLGLSEKVANQKLLDMSGGQQTKVLLTRFLLEPADILVLDEPTNNLDIPSLLWLETFLTASKKAMIIISHDLVFLDTVVNRVFELKDGKLNIERGTYSDYIDRKKKDFAKQKREYKAYMEKVAQLEGNIKSIQSKSESIDEFEAPDSDKQGASYVQDRASSSQGRVSTIKNRIGRLDKVDKPFEEDPFELEIEPSSLEGANIRAENLVAGHKEGLKVGPISFEFNPGDRICLMGMNGVGKSTLLQTIVGNIKAIEGEIIIGDGVLFGDLLQQHERADRTMKAVDFFINQTKSNTEKAIHLLKRSGFSEENLKQSIGGLSSGMRARLLFAVFVALGTNVLVLDEPTNHLDIEGVIALKDLLSRYKGAVILVSHNRWFLEDLEIGTFYNIENGKLERIKDFDLYIKSAHSRANDMIKKIKRVSHIFAQ